MVTSLKYKAELLSHPLSHADEKRTWQGKDIKCIKQNNSKRELRDVKGVCEGHGVGHSTFTDILIYFFFFLVCYQPLCCPHVL